MKIRVSFEIDTDGLHPEATREEVQKWLEYQLGATGGINRDNVLSPYDIENANCVTFDEI